jgi:hypothetical protein
MQARNFPDVDAELDELLDELDGVLDELDGADDEPLEPHAAASKATTLKPAAILTVPFTVTSSAGAVRGRPEGSPAQSGGPGRLGREMSRKSPPGCPKVIPGDAILEGGNRPLAALLRNRDR